MCKICLCRYLKLFMARLFVLFLVEKCAACHRKSDFGWIGFTHFPLRIIKRAQKSLKRF